MPKCVSDSRNGDAAPYRAAELARALAELETTRVRLSAALAERCAGAAPALAQAVAALAARPDVQARHQRRFGDELLLLQQRTALALAGAGRQPPVIDVDDRRFDDPGWRDDPYRDYARQLYQLGARCLSGALGDPALALEPALRRRALFYLRQYLDAAAPSNLPTLNPRVLAAARASDGDSLRRGLARLRADRRRTRKPETLRPPTVDRDAFALGVSVATTPGAVVWQSRLAQLIQYRPLTRRVYRRPLLMVPPWINKYYILDLQPHNSLIRWTVEQGFSVFVLSWVNPDASHADAGLDDYLYTLLDALDAVAAATGEGDVNALGYCLGGTLLTAALAWLAAEGSRSARSRVASATLLTTLLDFSDVGELGAFIDTAQLDALDRAMAERGYLDAQRMADAFSLLRANDLIWSAWINAYLLGKPPPAADLLYWNADGTRMPRRMHDDYLRALYLDNRLRDGVLELAGRRIDLGAVEQPLYVVATAADHIAPWRGVYAGARLLGGKIQFTLGGSGHIAGIVNPPQRRKCSFRSAALGIDDADPERWRDRARPRPGSWWPHWAGWLKRRGGAKRPARVPGDGALDAIEPAPGGYVRVRFDD